MLCQSLSSNLVPIRFLSTLGGDVIVEFVGYIILAIILAPIAIALFCFGSMFAYIGGMMGYLLVQTGKEFLGLFRRNP
jgi:hypothetical protein